MTYSLRAEQEIVNVSHLLQFRDVLIIHENILQHNIEI